MVSTEADGTNAITVMFPAVEVTRAEENTMEEDTREKDTKEEYSREEDTKEDPIGKEEGTVRIW